MTITSPRPVTAAPAPVRHRALAPVLALVLCALVAAAAVAVHVATGHYWGDLTAYRAGAQAAAGGDGHLYGVALTGIVPGSTLAFVYPPFAALLMLPLSALGLDAAIGLWTFASVLALIGVTWLSLAALPHPVDPRRRGLLSVVVAGLALPLFPVSGHLQVGQIGLFLVLLVLADLTGTRTGRWRGIGVGIAAGIKLTPLIFVLYLLVTRQYRAAATALGTFAATIALTALWRPHDTAHFFGGAGADSSRIATDPRMIVNQSLRGALARITDTATPSTGLWLALAALVGVGGLLVAALAARRGEELLALVCCALTGLLISPISWHHHWVWCVPGLILLADAARRSGRRLAAVTAAAWLALVASTAFVIPTVGGWDRHFTGWALLPADLYVLMGLAALVGAAVHVTSRPNTPVTSEVPA